MMQDRKRGTIHHPIMTRTYELIEWFAPVINGLSPAHKFTLGDRIINNLYAMLEELILIQHGTAPPWRVEFIVGRLDIVRHQTRMMHEFALIEDAEFAQSTRLLDAISDNLDSWISWVNCFPARKLHELAGNALR
ncbi:MAG: four helix bundle protein [Blastocatellia bacterium]|nr:four helix bundle protein [Blastocatellia bacterium]